jgi:hypothetical protein
MQAVTMNQPIPRVVVLAGPNGAGKSTSARRILMGALQVGEFVNADTIAQGLSGFSPESVSIGAGRLMLARLRELAGMRKSFAFETTLASRSFAPWLQRLREEGYEVSLVFLWPPTLTWPSLALLIAYVWEGMTCRRQRFDGDLLRDCGISFTSIFPWQIAGS